MDKGQESCFPSQHPYRVWVKYNLQSETLESSCDSGHWYSRFPRVKVGNTSKTSNGTENERNFHIGTNSYNEIAENMTQELTIYIDKISVYSSKCC